MSRKYSCKGVGAIVGGVTGKKKLNDLCTEMYIKVVTRNTNINIKFIYLITSSIKRGGFSYNSAKSSAYNIMAELESVIEISNKESHETQIQQNISIADELIKYKQLLDSGAISQEEFNQLKKDLMQ